MDKTIGLYIGRFQPFHNGHKSIIDTMLKDNDENLVLIGVTGQNISNDDPFSYSKRLSFISETYTNNKGLHVCPLIDNDSDERWVKQILGIGYMQNVDNIKIYCGDKKEDSAIKIIQQYKNLFIGKKIEIIEIDRNIVPISGTQVRFEMKEQGVAGVEELVPGKVYDQLKKTG